MPVVRELLPKFLDKSSRKPFLWGESDCMLDIADWLAFATKDKELRDVGSKWRSRYSTQQECEALLEPMGGLVGAMKTEAKALGLESTDQPEPGDIAMVEGFGDKPMGAIMMMSGRWRVRTEKGFVVSHEFKPIVAWKLPA